MTASSPIFISLAAFLLIEFAAGPAGAALDEGAAESGYPEGFELSQCPRNLRQGADEELERTIRRVEQLQEAKGSTGASARLESSRRTFEQCRKRKCEFRKLVAGSAVGDKLLGATWLVEDIGGWGVIDFLQSTLTFDNEEKISGMGGCNSYFGSVKIDGDAIEFGPIGATRMACGEAIDDQERRFFQGLGQVRSFTFDRGLLLLLDSDGRQVIRLSRKS